MNTGSFFFKRSRESLKRPSYICIVQRMDWRQNDVVVIQESHICSLMEGIAVEELQEKRNQVRCADLTHFKEVESTKLDRLTVNEEVRKERNLRISYYDRNTMERAYYGSWKEGIISSILDNMFEILWDFQIEVSSKQMVMQFLNTRKRCGLQAETWESEYGQQMI